MSLIGARFTKTLRDALLFGALLACSSTTTNDTAGPSVAAAPSEPRDPREPSEGDGGGCAPSDADPSDCDAPLVPGADRRCTIEVGGQKRSFLVYAPKIYDPCKPAALVVDAHGASESAEAHAGKEAFYDWPLGFGSGFRLVAEREGFVVVQPQGIDNRWSKNDVAFVRALPAAVGAHAKIDPARVFLSGISNGGELTYLTACSDQDVFKAFAPISGFTNAGCAGRAAPLVAFHSPDDAIISMAAGRSAFDAWKKAHHCGATSRVSLELGGAGSDPRALCFAASGGGAYALGRCSSSAPVTRCETWSGCDGGTTATFCTVPPDKEHRYDTTGGHILYFNASSVAVAAVAWELFAGRLERP